MRSSGRVKTVNRPGSVGNCPIVVRSSPCFCDPSGRRAQSLLGIHASPFRLDVRSMPSGIHRLEAGVGTTCQDLELLVRSWLVVAGLRTDSAALHKRVGSSFSRRCFSPPPFLRPTSSGQPSAGPAILGSFCILISAFCTLNCASRVRSVHLRSSAVTSGPVAASGAGYALIFHLL